jgi:hypothetical protein
MTGYILLWSGQTGSWERERESTCFVDIYIYILLFNIFVKYKIMPVSISNVLLKKGYT